MIQNKSKAKQSRTIYRHVELIASRNYSLFHGIDVRSKHNCTIIVVIPSFTFLFTNNFKIIRKNQQYNFSVFFYFEYGGKKSCLVEALGNYAIRYI